MNRHPGLNVPSGTAERGTHFRSRGTHGDGGFTPDTGAGGVAAADAAQGEQVTTGAISPGSVLFGGYQNMPDGIDATVVIDKDGLHVNDGALFLEDEFGSSVLVASGFSGAWNDFVSLGLYNSRFLAGSGATNLPVGRTINLPYWAIAISGLATVDHVVDVGARANFTALGQVVQFSADRVPVRPDAKYQVPLTIAVAGATLITLRVDVFWMQADGINSATPAFTTANFRGAAVTFSGTGTVSYEMDPVQAPADAATAIVSVYLTETLHGGACTATMMAVGLREAAPENMTSQDLTLGGDLTINGRMPMMAALPFVLVTGYGGSATTQFDFGDSAISAVGRMAMPWAGSVAGISLRSTAARTAGTATMHVLINGAPNTLMAPVLNAANPSDATANTARGNVLFAQGDTLGARIVTSGWTPLAADLYGVLYVVFDLVD